MILKILEDAYTYKNIISIMLKYSNLDDPIIGYITKINDDEIIINEIDEYGKHIGSIIIKIDDIRCITIDGWHIRGLTFMSKNNLILDPSANITVRHGNSEWMSSLKLIKENDKVAEFIFENGKSAVGKILKFNSKFLLIQTIGEDGWEDGTSCYRISDIEELNYDCLIEQKIKLLFDLNHARTL